MIVLLRVYFFVLKNAYAICCFSLFSFMSNLLRHLFVQSEQHQALQESLRTLDACDGLWRLCGPPNKCRYFELKLDSPARIKLFDRQVAGAVSKIRSLLELFHSEEMFLFLSNITGTFIHSFLFSINIKQFNTKIINIEKIKKRKKQHNVRR